MSASASVTRKRLLVFRPTIGQGGADRNTLILLQLLDRKLFALQLALMKREGEFLVDLPSDVELHVLDASSLWTAWWPLWKLLRSDSPDIVLSTSSGGNIPTALAHLLAHRRIRLVLSERSTIEREGFTLKRRLTRQLKRWLYQRADAIAAISQGVQNDVIRNLRVSPDKVSVVYNPVLDESLRTLWQEPVEHPWFSEEIPVVLAAGRMVPAKDYPTLLRAFRLVRDRCVARLLILGEGHLRAELECLVKHLGLESDVSMPGFDKNPFRYMARCQIYVLSSIFEGLGSALIQAMACGAPVIATDCPFGPAEIIIEPGRDGILVPPRDFEALAREIVRLLEHPEVRRELSACGQRSAERFRAEAALTAYTKTILGT
jgi:glycosyltransferase involved in cell wall biosynthesis